ncbi:MAG TPA: TolC family protein [Pseudomonadales bacterium]
MNRLFPGCHATWRPHSSYRIILYCLLLLTRPADADTLEMQQAIEIALSRDEELLALAADEQALRHQAGADGQLPDPSLSVSAMNIPLDSGSLRQDNMTQLSVGVSQYFPPAGSRQLQTKTTALQADITALERQQRRAWLRMTVSELWLDNWQADRAIALIQQQRPLFEQLMDTVNSRYRQAGGNGRQQDVLAARLALTRLDDRLAMLHSDARQQQALLARWLTDEVPAMAVANTLPATRPVPDAGQLARAITRHPRLQIANIRWQLADTRVALAEKAANPGWRLSASYGYRSDAPNGMARSDLLSLGISIDLPRHRRRQPQLAAAQANRQADALDYPALHATLQAEARQQLASLQQLAERQQRYRQQLLPQLQQLADAALAAYQHDNGSASDVLNARIELLNGHIDALALSARYHKTLARLDYYLDAGDPQENNNENR